MVQSNSSQNRLRVVRAEEVDELGGPLPALRELCRPLANTGQPIQERGFRKMKYTSSAFQTAFLALNGLDDRTREVLEERIPEKTSIEVGLDAYQMLAEEVLKPDYPVEGRGEIEARLRKAGYGITKPMDVQAGSHSHPEPHWLRVLSIVRDAIILSNRKDREKIEQVMKGNTNGWGNRIKDMIVECGSR